MPAHLPEPDERNRSYFDFMGGADGVGTPTDARLIELTAINRRLRQLLNCCPDLGLGMADIAPNEEKALSDRVDAVCNDLIKGTVPPRQVDQLADAVRRNRQDAAVGRALRFSA